LYEGIIYANFDYLKASGRISSRGSDLFPSMNSQNIPRIAGKLSIRECHIARPGYILCASDYSGLELCSAGQQTFRIVGHSTLMNSINAGIDSHAFLGAQICHKWDADFARTCLVMGARTKDEIYGAFLEMKVDNPKLFKHYRTFAKPTGLGYPGGLGPAKFMEFARTSYEVPVTMEEAIELRELWHETYPEWKPYFSWVNAQGDPYNLGELHYFSPLGMRRAATTYCATANGVALQTPSAEGMKAAHWKVTRACWDPSEGSILFGCRVVLVIHDELIVEMPDDSLASERAKEIQRIMEITMAKFLPDVRISTEAALMRRWYKEAEPVFGPNNELLLWETTHQKAS
jgi:DNA polymerase I-like protein with 3'-5' exonuclease and polymerase domains